MNLSYPVKHWLATIAFAPLNLVLYDIFIFRNNATSTGIEFYSMFLFFGFVFSLPVFGVYVFAYRMIVKSKMPFLAQRVILLIGVVVATLLMLAMIGGYIMKALMISYSIALNVTTWFFDFGNKIEEKLIVSEPVLFDMVGKVILTSRLDTPLESIKIQSFIYNGKDEIESIYLRFDKWIRLFFDNGVLFVQEEEFGLMSKRTEHEDSVIEYRDYAALDNEFILVLHKKLIGFEKAERFKLILKFENEKNLILSQIESEPWVFGQCMVEIA